MTTNRAQILISAIDQTRGNALLDAAGKEPLEDFRSPTFARFA